MISLKKFFKDSLPGTILNIGTSFAKLYSTQSNEIGRITKELIHLQERVNISEAIMRSPQKEETPEAAINRLLEAVSGVTDDLSTARRLDSRIEDSQEKIRVLSNLVSRTAKRGEVFKFNGDNWVNLTEKDLTKMKNEMVKQINGAVENMTRSLNDRVRETKIINKRLDILENPKTPKKRSRAKSH